MQGYIIHFNEEKGYGFIDSDEHEENIFVHISEVTNADSLEQGQEVTFQIEKKRLKGSRLSWLKLERNSIHPILFLESFHLL